MIAAFKYPGAKWSYAEWINYFIPPHKYYLEPYFGSGGVFFNKEPAQYETVNDIDGLVVNFFRACRDYPDQLARAINLTPFSRQEYMQIQENKAGEEIALTGDCVEDARRFAVRCSQSFGPKLADRSGWRNTKCSKGPINPKIWSRVPDTVYQMSARLKHAQIEQTDALQLIRDYNNAECFIYADPPYLGETRNNSRLYRAEMMNEQNHIELLNVLLAHKGPVILSGYDNDLYNQTLSGWRKEQKQGRASSAGSRTETIWMNFDYQLKF